MVYEYLVVGAFMLLLIFLAAIITFYNDRLNKLEQKPKRVYCELCDSLEGVTEIYNRGGVNMCSSCDDLANIAYDGYVFGDSCRKLIDLAVITFEERRYRTNLDVLDYIERRDAVLQYRDKQRGDEKVEKESRLDNFAEKVFDAYEE